jgi:hypothetical protein
MVLTPALTLDYGSVRLTRHSESIRPANPGRPPQADARIRTGDPFITSEVLYQLSYVGICRDFSELMLACATPCPPGVRTFPSDLSSAPREVSQP